MLGEVAWWTGSMDESIEARTRAYAARLERESRAAALNALRLARDHELKRSGPGAWLSRAESRSSTRRKNAQTVVSSNGRVPGSRCAEGTSTL